MNNIYSSVEKLQQEIYEFQSEGKKIVTYNGSFDLLHVGHIRSIREAKQQGDILILLVNSDKSIKQYKSSKRPIVSQKDRTELLSELKEVDGVILFDELNPKKILSKLKPDVHCNGSDWGKNCVEKDVVEQNGGRLHILSWQDGFSTSNLIQRILSLNKKPLDKAVFIDRDGTINENFSGYIHKIEDFKFLPGVIEALQKLSKTDYKIFIITNQSGIARKYFSHQDYINLTNWMHAEMQKKHIRIDKIYHCPHHPDDKCTCRKPNVGMLMQAVDDFDISLNDSWIVGDQDSDILLGREANVKTIKLGRNVSKNSTSLPNFTCQSLLDAVSVILK